MVSQKDKQLFRKTVGAVTPLKTNKRSNTVKTQQEKPMQAPYVPNHSPPPDVPLSDYIQDPVRSNDVLHWANPPLPIKRLKELKQGKIRFSKTIDLHGLNQEDARQQLLKFLHNAHRSDHRCVLIVHGKGGQHNPFPKIKNLINRWLPQHPLTRAFHSAISKHGGNGAVYVLLTRCTTGIDDQK